MAATFPAVRAEIPRNCLRDDFVTSASTRKRPKVPRVEPLMAVSDGKTNIGQRLRVACGGRQDYSRVAQKRSIHSALIIYELSDPRAAGQVTVASAFAEPE